MGFWQNLFGGRSAGPGEAEGDDRQRIQHQLESQAHSVSLRRLRSYGLQSVRVIDASTIQGIVNSALNEALRLRGVPITPKEREEIESLARAQLQGLMDENRRLTSAKDEVERREQEAARRREEFELSIAVLRKELEERQKELEAERQKLGRRSDSGRVAIPPLPGARTGQEAGGLPEWGAGIPPRAGSGVGVVEPTEGEAPPRPRFLPRDGDGEDEGAAVAEGPPVKVVAEFADDQFSRMESRLQLVFQRLVRDRELFQKNEAGEWIPHLESLEVEVREVLSKLVAEAKAAAGADGGGEKVEFLEKRIAKLNEALAAAEGNLAKLARMKGIDPGVASLFDGVQGLSDDDPNFARKSELLTQVFNENLELQGKPVDGSPAAAPVVSAAPTIPVVPSSFDTPVDVSGEVAF